MLIKGWLFSFKTCRSLDPDTVLLTSWLNNWITVYHIYPALQCRCFFCTLSLLPSSNVPCSCMKVRLNPCSVLRDCGGQASPRGPRRTEKERKDTDKRAKIIKKATIGTLSVSNTQRNSKSQSTEEQSVPPHISHRSNISQLKHKHYSQEMSSENWGSVEELRVWEHT